MSLSALSARSVRWGRRGFSLPELLIVCGIMALLISILLPPLSVAHRQARAAKCAAQLQQLGRSLEGARNDYAYFPVWDDSGSPKRYTWIDVLIEGGYLSDRRVGYCPDDPAPGPLNSARGAHYQINYPGRENCPGIDYSYGLAAPLSAGAWNWRSGFGDGQKRRLDDHQRYPAQRVLAADSCWSVIYNLSGEGTCTFDWSYPTQYDNTVDYRHPNLTANLLLQDGHVERVEYEVACDVPVNTANCFVWYPGESANVGPDDEYRGNFYPNEPAVNMATGADGVVPKEMVPGFYTSHQLWTRISHK